MVDVLCRIIPTRMGTRLDLLRPKLTYWDHPHAYGDKRSDYLYEYLCLGSSPRVWGQVCKPFVKSPVNRIIPTRMGTSLVRYGLLQSSDYHPHACGDKRYAQTALWHSRGSSPRVWGQVNDIRENGWKGGIIPTRVGTRTKPVMTGVCSLDHPHACGDKCYISLRNQQYPGASPRVWGQAV